MDKATKDKIAWAAIYGSYWAMKTVILGAAVAAGMVDRGQSFKLSCMDSKAHGEERKKKQDEAWELYQRTGDLGRAMKRLLME